MATAQTLVDIRNTSDIERKVLFNKKIEVIYPQTVRSVPRELASAFVEEHPSDVQYYVPVKLPPIGVGERVVWLANVTGNPFAPDEVMDIRIVKGKREEYKVQNPNKRPIPVKGLMGVGQLWQKNPHSGEEECINLPKIAIEIPPFARIRCGHFVADWLMVRDGMSGIAHRGKLLVCNEPGDCEPNDSWSLDEIRQYALFVDSVTFSQAEHIGPSEADLKADPAAVLEAKELLLRKVFFRVVDPKYSKPTRSQWDGIKQALAEKNEQKKPVPKFVATTYSAPVKGA
jgi:hypothetical protein